MSWKDETEHKILVTGGFGGDTVQKDVTFANTSGTVNLFTITGDVVVRIVAVAPTSVASALGCNGSVGIAGLTTLILPLTDITKLVARRIWFDNNPSAEGVVLSSAMIAAVISDGNDIILTLSAQADSGAVTFYCIWTPLSANGNVVAA